MTHIAMRRHKLEQERHGLQDRLHRIHLDRTRANGPVDPDFSDQAIERENDEVLAGLERSVISELGRIEHALAHLERGGGDQCENCGHLISHERLLAVIHATQCETCARTQAAGGGTPGPALS